MLRNRRFMRGLRRRSGSLGLLLLGSRPAPGTIAARFRVLNTDTPALVGVLAQALGNLANKRIAIIGAGGVGRAAAMGLAAAGASVVISVVGLILTSHLG